MKRYLSVYGALLALLGATFGLAYLDLGAFNVWIALAIAGVKASLVVLFFMHLADSEGIAWIAFGAGFVWLTILFGLTFADYASRPSPRVPVTPIFGSLPGGLDQPRHGSSQ